LRLGSVQSHHSHVGGAADIWSGESTLIGLEGDLAGSWWNIDESPVRLVIVVAAAAGNRRLLVIVSADVVAGNGSQIIANIDLSVSVLAGDSIRVTVSVTAAVAAGASQAGNTGSARVTLVDRDVIIVVILGTSSHNR
jgi:hypothetical protein